ncbi:MAG: 6,7-dimethyl-8-ribityllumazine synthase [Gemmatimonadota bacterium]
MKEISGGLDGTGMRFALVVSRFNHLVTDQLLAGAVDCLARHGVEEDAIEVVRVPGAWELPGAVARLLERGDLDGVVALGCVIRGATPHFDYVAGEAAGGLGALNRSASIPIGFGVLTTDTLEQGLERAGSKAGNKGWDAAVATLEMAALYRKLR